MENNEQTELEAQNQPSCLGGVSGSYCVRKHDLFALTYPKVAENLTKDDADKLQKEMQTKSIEQTGCEVPIFFVSEV